VRKIRNVTLVLQIISNEDFLSNTGKVKSTKNRKPLQFIYSEEYENKSDAMKREKYFKTNPGRNFLDSIGK